MKQKHITPKPLTQTQMAAKIAAKHGIAKKLATEILEHIAELAKSQRIIATPVSEVDAMAEAAEAAIEKAEQKLKRKLERSYEAACNVAIKAFRSRKFPESPVILFGDDGFFFGDEFDPHGTSVTADLSEEFYNEECDPDDLTPPWCEVYEFLSSVFARGDDWAEVLKTAIKTGDYSELLES